MTWKDFSIIVLGNEKRELNEWARTRNLAYIIYLSNSTEHKSMKSFWHIPQLDDVEDEEEVDYLTEQQLQRTLSLYGIKA